MLWQLWEQFLQLTGVEGSTDAAWKVVETAWFTDRQMPALPLIEASAEVQEPLLAEHSTSHVGNCFERS